MDKELRTKAWKQYLHYFWIWFFILIVLLVIFGGIIIKKRSAGRLERGNQAAPIERVYDFADVLTDKEEEDLRELIAKKETEGKFDIVLVTIKEAVETDSVSWETAMMNYADNFYDSYNYGYDKIHGDGVLLLDNWQEGQKGSWLCTTGKVYRQFSTYDVDLILDAVYNKVEKNPYIAYQTYIEKVVNKMNPKSENRMFFFAGILLIPLITAISFMLIKMQSKSGEKTVVSSTYVADGKPIMHRQSDEYIRKFVTKRHIPQNNGGSGGSRSSGGGGSHRSSGGVTHGGGGRRR